MPSTYSANLRLEKQATGENRATWGTKANTVFEMIEDAISGWVDVSMADAAYALTTNNGAEDEARQMMLNITGAHTAVRVLTIPTVDKMYLIRNATTGGFAVTVDNGTNNVSVGNGETRLVSTNGTNVYRSVDLANSQLETLSAFDTNGLVTQTATGVFAGRTITGTANEITVTNGDGVAGNPTLSLPANVTVSGDVTATAFNGSVDGGATDTFVLDDGGFRSITTDIDGITMGGPNTGATLGPGAMSLTSTTSASATAVYGASSISISLPFSAPGATTPNYTVIGDTDTGMYFTTTANTLYFATGGSEAGRFDSSQNFHVTGGVTVTGGQIVFPGTQNASADPNTLDDYEEGTFTPTLTFGGGSTGITYGAQTGIYTKIGKMVYVSARIQLTAKGSSTGGAVLNGLPFAHATISQCGVSGRYLNMSGLSSGFIGYGNAATIILATNGAANHVQLTQTNFTDTSDFYFTGTYMTAN